MTTPESPSTPDRSFVNIPVLPPPLRSPHKSPKIQPQSPSLPLPPVQSPIPTTPKSALRFPQLEPRSRSNSNTSNRSRSPSPLRKVVFSPKEELIGKSSKESLPSLSDLKDLNQRDLKELKEQQERDFRDFRTEDQVLRDIRKESKEKSKDTPTTPSSPKGRSKSVGAESSPLASPSAPTLTPQPTMHSTPTTLPSYINPVSTAFSLGLAVGLSISAIRPTLEKAVNHGSSWLAWLFKTVILWTVIGAAAYMAFTLGKAVLVTVQQQQQQKLQQQGEQKDQKVHQLPPTPRADPFEGLQPHKSSSGSTVSASSASSGKSSTSQKSSGSAASIYEFNKYVDEQKVKRRGQKDEEHSFRPYPARPQLSSTAPGKIYGNMK